jgi:hypothetical protein
MNTGFLLSQKGIGNMEVERTEGKSYGIGLKLKALA